VGGTVHDYRLDRGRIRGVNRVAGSIALLERDGTVVTVPVAATARVTIDGRPTGFDALRRGMRALTVRDGDAAAEVVQATLR
jgi:hypothetical protein